MTGRCGIDSALQPARRAPRPLAWRPLPAALGLLALAVLSLAGCGSASKGSGSAGQFSVGGAMSGLTGAIQLLNNGGDALSAAADGPFTFKTLLSDGAAYAVTVQIAAIQIYPPPPVQSCQVANGSGTVSGANVDNVQVTCTTRYWVEGTISGASGPLTVQNAGDTPLTITLGAPAGTGAPTYVFSSALPAGAAYHITVTAPPAGQACLVINGSGTIGVGNVTNVQITCGIPFKIGGNVTGLAGTLVLQNNGGDNLTLGAPGAFQFATGLVDGALYSVSVLTPPSGQVCTVNAGSGAVRAANVTTVQVFCSAPGYPVGGTVTGLSGSLVLQNNGGDNLTVSAPGSFQFLTALADGASYAISVLTEPNTQLCTLGGRIGTVSGGPVTSVLVNCQTMTCTSSTVALDPQATLDPLVPCQWWFKNTGQTAFADSPGVAGQDINYGTPAVDGSGVVVAVADTGLEIAHEDLMQNVVADAGAMSCNFLASATTTSCSSTDPTNTDPLQQDGDHGTSVGGLIAARSGNGLGGQGVAGRASLVGFNVLQSQSVGSFSAALGQASYSSGVSVFNASFGVDSVIPLSFDTFFDTLLRNGVGSLRGGKGAIYVKAAGNGFRGYQDFSFNPPDAICQISTLSCQNASMDPDNTLPWGMVVGAVNANGVRSSYSTAGSALWVSAPAGEYGGQQAVIGSGYIPVVYQPAMTTTDQTGCVKGYSGSVSASEPLGVINRFDFPGTSEQLSYNPNCNYTSTFNGTSSATPVTSGVAALLLQANPALTWRDVKYILARTAQQVDSATAGQVTIALTGGAYVAEQGWINNHAATPFHFHNWYGFGRVDVTAALALAQGFLPNSFGGPTAAGAIATAPVSGFSAGSPGNVFIPDGALAGASSGVTLGATGLTLVEAVQVQLSVSHLNVGSLGIELTSPSGTRSVLLNAFNGFWGSADFTGTVLLSNAFYGEPVNGTWTLKVVDANGGGVTGTLMSWGIRVYGH